MRRAPLIEGALEKFRWPGQPGGSAAVYQYVYASLCKSISKTSFTFR